DQPKFAAHNARYSRRIGFVLFGEDARRKRLDRIIIEDGHDALFDDRAAVERLIDEVNGAAGPLHPVFESLALRIEPRERGQQARMDVERAPTVSFDEDRREKAHVTGKTNQIDVPRAQCGDDLPFVIRTRAPTPFDDERFD